MSADAEVKVNQIFIGGLPAETTLDGLNSHLASLNVTVVTSSLFQDSDGRSKGCALAEFQTADEAIDAVSVIDKSVLDDKEIFARADRGPRRQQRHATVNQDMTWLYVGNLTLEVQADEIRELFAEFGTVTNASIGRNKRRDNFEQTRGWGTVQFSSVAEAEAAMAELNGTQFQGRDIDVEVLKSPPRERKPRERKAREPRTRAAEDATAEPPNKCSVFVGNLQTDEEDDLEALFAPFGEVVKVEIARNRRWGAVDMATEDQAAAAVAALHGSTFQEAELTVEPRLGPAKRERRQRKPRGERRGGDDEDNLGGRRRQREPREPRERKEPELVSVANPGCHLFVGNFGWDVTDDELADIFAPIGTVVNATVTMNKKQDRSRGWGTVEMSNAAEAEQAAGQLHDFEYKERALVVRLDKHVVAY